MNADAEATRATKIASFIVEKRSSNGLMCLIQGCCELTHFSPKVPSGLNILVVEIHGRTIKNYELITSHLVEDGVHKILLSRQSHQNKRQSTQQRREETQNGWLPRAKSETYSNCQQSTANIACFVKFWMLH